MSCAACSARIEKVVGRLQGVENVSVNLLTNTMLLEGDADPKTVIGAIEKAGFGASLSDDSEERPNDLKRRLFLSVIVLIALMYLAMGHTMFGFPLPHILEDNPVIASAIQLVLTALIMVINRRFFISGTKAVLNKAPNMDTLVSLGAGASFVWSLIVCVYMTVAFSDGKIMAAKAYYNDLYFESAGMILTLITIGKLLEAKSKDKTIDALKGLMNLAPKKATLIRDGNEVVVDIKQVNVGDVFVVKAGEKIPVDGTVTEGTGRVDESMLTGESVPVDKMPGSDVYAATINQRGTVICSATAVRGDTTLSRIISMVSDASATKAPIARIADKASGVFVPAVLIIAVATVAIWLLIGQNVDFALARGISVLVISCPCALGLATPVAIMVGNGVAAKNNILFKNAESLEHLGKVGTIALDKTGTITRGITEVANIADGERPDDKLLESIAQNDAIREDSAEAVSELKKLGIHTVMLTGDKEETAERIAAEAGVDEVRSSLLPDGKLNVIEELKRDKDTVVAMVGDGINDAPSLKAADCGIAIGAGTDIAIDAADIVLMKSSLKDVVRAVKISRATIRNIKQNLFWAFFYNAICIPLAAGVYYPLWGLKLSPMFGALAMSLSSVCVVSNALRLNLTKLE